LKAKGKKKKRKSPISGLIAEAEGKKKARYYAGVHTDDKANTAGKGKRKEKGSLDSPQLKLKKKSLERNAS